MDYPDKMNEKEKAKIVKSFEAKFSEKKKKEVQSALISLVGEATINSYVYRVKARLCALPQEIRFILRHDSVPIIFDSIGKATNFLNSPEFNMNNPSKSYVYQSHIVMELTLKK